MNSKYHRLSKGKNEEGKRILIDEHRYVMEQFLQRKLTKNEVVHHIDEDKTNNDIENLQVLTRSEHSRLHRLGKKLSDTTKIKIGQKSKHRPVYCKRKINDEQLISMLIDYKNGMKLREIDRKYNLSNGTMGTIIRGKIYYDKKELIKSILN